MMQEAISADAPIVCAWERRRILTPQLDALYAENAPRLMRDRIPEAHLETALDEALEVIRGTVAHSLSGLSAQLWTALYLTSDFISVEHEAAMISGDLAVVERYDAQLEFNARVIVAALRSVNAMEVGNA